MVPRADAWSLVAEGRPWTSQDWLANVVLALGNSLGPWGQTGLSVLFGGLTVLSFWILWRAMAVRRPTIGWASRIIWLSAGLALAGPVMGVRVQVFDLLMASVVVWLAWHFTVDHQRRWLVGLPVVAALWANLHAGWPLLFLLCGAVMVGEALDRALGRSLAGGDPMPWRAIRDLGLALVVSAVALVLNPNGIDLYTYPLMTVGITALNRYVMEWFPASLDTLFGQLLAAFAIVACLPALVFGRRNLRLADALIIVGLMVMAWQAIRFLLITGPIVAAVAGVVLTPVVLATPIGRRVGPVFDRLSRPRQGGLGRVNAVLIVVLAVIGLGVAGIRVSPAAQAAEQARSLPVEAVRWMNDHEPGNRIFNRYEWGGYIGQQRPDEPIFMDGRADVYGDELLQEYVSIIGLHDDPQIQFDRYGIDHAVFPPDTPLADWFDSSAHWKRVFDDETAVVWVRR